MIRQLTTHPRTFGLAYKTQPQNSNIHCRIHIRVMVKPTVSALKPLPTAITLPLDGVEMSAARAGLRRVGRGNKQNRHTGDRSFIAHKQPQLIERPIVCTSTLSLASGFFVQTFSDTRQVFKRQGCILRQSLLYQFSTDVVVHPLLKALL